MKKFETLGRSLTKDEQKKINGGDECVDCGGGGEAGCGTGISCANKAAGDSCGTKSCICENHSGGLWCTTQL